MNKLILSLIAILLPFFPASAQNFEFTRLDNGDGLSNNQIAAIFKDSKGFMWFATNSGLNRYDGHHFKIFKHDKKNQNTMGSDKVIEIQEDADGKMWLQLSDSIYDIYDPKTESFSHEINSLLQAKGLPQNPARVLISKEKDIYAYYRRTGIYWFNHKTRKSILFRQNGRQLGVFSKGDVMRFAVSERFIWILLRNGLLERIDKSTGKLDFRNTYFLTSKSTIEKTMLIDTDGDLWIYPSIDDKGTAYLDMKSLKWNFLKNANSSPISQTLVRFVIQDNRGLFWIGTDHGGIHVYDKKKTQSTVLTHDFYNESSISQNSTISGYCDNNGIVWIGTYKNGICYYHPEFFKFKKPRLFYLFRQDSETFDCNSLFKDKNGDLWIGTNGAGLIRYNEKLNQTQIYRVQAGNPNSISSDIITSITADRNSVVWIGTFLGGLNAFDGKGFRHYQFDEKNPNSLGSKSVYGIVEDKDRNLWIATLGGGLNRLNPERNKFTRYTTSNNKNILSNYILSMHLGHNNDVFLSTDRGVNWITEKGGQGPAFHTGIKRDQLSGENCNNILLDSRGLVWIATDKGITIYHPKEKAYTYVNQENGLPDDEIVSLLEDNNRQVWAGTRKGLSKISYSSKTGGESVSVTTFDSKDGLPSPVCNLNAAFKDDEGKIYIGTIKGYVEFDPNKIATNNIVPEPTFTELQISNRQIEPNEEFNGRVIIKRSISELNELILKYNETNFSLMFSSLNYMHPEKNIYKYKLDGLDADWNIIKKGDGVVSYSNLTPGKYLLTVYASNNDGVWSKTPLKLSIIVQPPFWSTWWAYLIYILILLTVLWQWVKYKLRKQTEEFEQAQIVLNAKKMHEVDELKFKFFTNISHEFKTPITLIVAPVDKLLKEEESEEHRELLGIIRRNAMTLLNMVNEILEFRKLDLNKLTLKLTKGDIVDFIRQICYSFSTLAKQKAIDFTFSSSLEKLLMEFDQEKMGRIITNLLSNAFKYTEYGEINVRMEVVENLGSDQKTLLIKVSDTGMGIDEADIDKIFERFFRIENHHKGNTTGAGVGLHLVSEYVKLHHGEVHVDSEVGKGSGFSVRIPISGTIDYSENLSPESSGLVAISANPEEKVGSTPHGQSKLDAPLLLIVDDNEDFRSFIAGLFADSYRLAFAQDGEEAVGIVIDQLPDVVLSDVMMPRMNGYELCKKLKADARTSNISVILITAKTSDENKFLGFEAGADDYVSKPFSIDLLVLKVSRMVQRRKKLLEAQKHKIDLSPSEIEITSESEKFVKRAIAIIEENISNPDFLVEDLCKKMAMSRVGFYKQILAITEKTPSELIRHIRLKRAAHLLEKSELYVNEIAFQVGFNDPKYFRKYFKDEFGVTPNEYKKQHVK
jgi:signal transduction histidine kinase/ligand-binding sensor domain-containing protein/DNA-binding response OmpR family regulator